MMGKLSDLQTGHPARRPRSLNISVSVHAAYSSLTALKCPDKEQLALLSWESSRWCWALGL